MAEKKANIKVSNMLQELYSDKQDLALEALIKLESTGNISLISDLFKAYTSLKDTLIKKKILEFLSNIQKQEACSEIVRLIENEKNTTLQQEFLTIIWNSKLDFSAYLANVISLAVKGDFMQALECLTIIENMPGPFQEEQLLEAQLYLKDYLENRKAEDIQKNQIVSDIALFVKNQNESSNADLLFE